MRINKMKYLGLKLVLLILLGLPELAGAQLFSYNQYGDVLVGFRKTGNNAGSYELVADVGSVTNLLLLPPGATTNINDITTTEVTNAFTDTGNFANLQWSVFAAFPNRSAWATPLGTFPHYTTWYTLPSTNVNSQTQAPALNYTGESSSVMTSIESIGNSATTIANAIGTASTNNNTFLVREPVATYSDKILSVYIGDAGFLGVAYGDFGGNNSPLGYVVENTTPSPFSAPQRDDFYELVPSGQTDPITGPANAAGYFVGYFLLYPSGALTFTSASAPVAAISGTATSGTAPLSVTFADASTGGITNWVWNFGDGQLYTNTVSSTPSHTYTSSGSYNVSLTVSGPRSSSPSTSSKTSFVVVSSGVAAPVAAFSGTPTNGFAPLNVIFTDTSTGTITNWFWSFGDGHTFNNTVSSTATNTYATNGSYSVSLTVTGPGGTNTSTQTGYVVASVIPKLSSLFVSGTNLILGGTNGPAGVQYRILSTTNLTVPLTNWVPVLTNTISVNGTFAYTNKWATTNRAVYFRLVSPSAGPG